MTRSCTRVRNLSTSQVQLVATADTGLIQLVESDVGEEWRDRARVHGDILGVVSRAIGLPPQEQEQVAAAAAATTAESVLDLGWGTAVVVTGLGQPGPASTFRAAGPPGPGLQPSPTTLAVSVDALAHGRSGARLHLHDSGGDVHSRLPTDRRRLSRRPVAAGHRHLHDLGGPEHHVRLPHSHARARWVELMDQTLGWVDTAQTRSVRTWLAASADAPGAQAYVDGLPVSFHTRVDEYTKETFGGISAECAPTVDDITACGP